MNRANQRRGKPREQQLHTAEQNALPPSSFDEGNDDSIQAGHDWHGPRALNSSHRVERSDDDSMARSSSCSAGGECGRSLPRPSPWCCDECAEILHQLANVITGVVVNAQMLDWKLPPYSRMKRPMVEIERSAQRGSELLKGLQQRLAQRSAPTESRVDGVVMDSSSTPLCAQSAERIAEEAGSLRHSARAVRANRPSDGNPLKLELTMSCDPCTSGIFPKRDDGR